ncbi:MAG: TatD family hydrolase [Coriobacteriia bacterium]|nr:TatD family hydrolase [Coriobacteriia bacterium]MCL2537225.1 TatD family hydrolase [Coriobacteriia bacterium]
MSSLDFVAYKGKKKIAEVQAIPDLQGAPLIETHAHLDMLEDPSLALARAAVVGISTVLTLTNLVEGAQATYEMLDVWREGAQNILDNAHVGPAVHLPDTYIITGVHPHNARLWTEAVEADLRRFAKDPRTVGIGEAGLDYYYDHSPREVQREVFARKLELASELDLPVVVHLRDAHEDGLRIMQEVGVPAAGAILHCFNKDLELAQPFIDLGCNLGFGGPVTFKNATDVKTAARNAPTGRFVVETDCPFMAPQPFRGQKCEPAHTLWVAQEVARLREVTLPVLARETTATARSIFKLPVAVDADAA